MSDAFDDAFALLAAAADVKGFEVRISKLKKLSEQVAAEQAQLKDLSGLVNNSYVQQLYKAGYYQQLQAKYGAFPTLSVQQIALNQPKLVNRNGKPAAAS